MQNETRQKANLQEKPYKITGPSLKLKWILKKLKNRNYEKSRRKPKFQKSTQKAANLDVFQNGKTHKWKQMEILVQNDLNQKSKFPGETPQNQLKLRNLKTGFEIDWNSILPELLGKTPGKMTRFWQSTIYGQFWKMSKLEKWKIPEFSLVPI